jgi:hypothetical protein
MTGHVSGSPIKLAAALVETFSPKNPLPDYPGLAKSDRNSFSVLSSARLPLPGIGSCRVVL